MKFQIVLVVEHLFAQVTGEFGANFMFELEMVAASARDGK